MKIKKTVVLTTVFFFNFFLIFLILSSRSEALSVHGLQSWTEDIALKSLSAVRDEIPRNVQADERNQMLQLVADQIFRGFAVSVKNDERGEPQFFFKKTGDSENWEVELVQPQLRSPVDEWFREDAKNLPNEFLSFLNELPIEALSWADSALKNQLETPIKEKLQGWDFSILVRVSDAKKILQISFTPKQPYVLSIATSVKSNALPVMFQTDLSAKLITDMSPIIGLPVAWAKTHEDKITRLAIQKLADRNAVTNIRASVTADFKTDQISKLEAQTDSERFFFALKLAAYAGSRAKVPELWLTAGWRTMGFTKLPLDLYSETFVTLDEFKVQTRLGARLEIIKNFMIGAEYASTGDAIWYRAWWDSGKKPYAWWRWNGDYGHNFALGYRLRDDISLELHFEEEIGSNNFSLRGILQF